MWELSIFSILLELQIHHNLNKTKTLTHTLIEIQINKLETFLYQQEEFKIRNFSIKLKTKILIVKPYYFSHIWKLHHVKVGVVHCTRYAHENLIDSKLKFILFKKNAISNLQHPK